MSDGKQHSIPLAQCALAAAAVLFLLGGGVPPRDPPERANDSLARDLAQAMLVHDRSIRTLEWDQVLRLEAGTPRESPWETRQSFDERGRWACRYNEQLRRSSDGSIVVLRGRMVFDGHAMSGTEETQESGTIEDYVGNRRTEAGIDCWLGRHVDGWGQKRLGEFLLDATDLHMEGPSSEGRPVVGATVVLNEVKAHVQVEIDPEHGFAPRSITIRDRAIGMPYWRYETTEFIEVDGIWLPCRGRHQTARFAPQPGEAERFQEALRSRGLSRQSDTLNPAVQAGYAEVLKEVFGRDEARSAPLVPPMEVEATYRNVNRPVEDAEFTLQFPVGYEVFDAFRNLVKRRDSTEWKKNGPRD